MEKVLRRFHNAVVEKSLSDYHLDTSGRILYRKREGIYQRYDETRHKEVAVKMFWLMHEAGTLGRAREPLALGTYLTTPCGTILYPEDLSHI